MDGELLGGVVAPLTGVYAVLLAMTAAWWRRAARGQLTCRAEGADPSAPPPPARALVRYLVTTAAMGAAVFMAVVLVFSYMFAGQQEALAEALTGGGALLGISLPLLFVAGMVERRLRSRE